MGLLLHFMMFTTLIVTVQLCNVTFELTYTQSITDEIILVIKNKWYHSGDIHFKKVGDKATYISNKIGCHGIYDFKVTPVDKTLKKGKTKVNANRDGVMDCQIIYNSYIIRRAICNYR